MMGHNIYFKGVIWKFIPKLSLLPHLIWSSDINNRIGTKARVLIKFLSLTTVKILKFGTPQTIAIIVLKIEKFDVTLHLCIQKMLMEWQTA